MGFETITVTLLSLLLIVFAIYLIGSWVFTTPYYPSRVKKLSRSFEKFNITLPERIRFIDLGSGDGRVVLWASKRGMEAEGIELNPFLTLFSKINALVNRKKVKIYNKSFFNHMYNNYDIVYLYQYSEIMKKLEDKLFKELKPNSIIISNTFKFPNITEDEKVDNFYIYIVK